MVTERRLPRRLVEPVDAASLALFRIVFGTLMLVQVGRYFAHGWIATFYQQPQLFFPYPGLEWLRPWPQWGMTAHFIVLGAAALGIMLGAWTRLSSAVFCLGFTYAHLIDKTNYLNHYHLLTLVSGLLALLPSGALWSVDAWRHPPRRRDRVPAWMVWLLRYQLAVVYVFAGLAKLNADWLWQAQPLRIWLAGLSHLTLIGPLLTWPPLAYVASWAGMFFDLLVVPALLWRRTRLLAYVAVVAFHLATAALFQIGIFPWVMIGLTPIFFDPSWPRRLRGGWSVGDRRPHASDATVGASEAQRPAWYVVAVVASYVVVQALLPLRPLLAGSEMLWTEEGFRFGWRVMLMEKFGEATMRVTDIATGATRQVDPRSYLTPLQYRMMTTQPDMILQFARWLARHETVRGAGEVEVRADVVVSLNGRPPRRLIDPAVDLSRVQYRVGHNEWITHFEAEPESKPDL